MNFGLTDETIKYICSVFIKHDEIETVIIHGSRAKGNYKIGSDIDLTLTGKNLTNDTLTSVIQEIDNLNTPYLFDISIFDNLNSPELEDHIQRVGKEFFKKK